MLRNTALVLVVLGVLPFAVDAPVLWRLAGPVVAGLLVARAAVLVWRRAFSTDPRHLDPAA